MLSAEEIQTFEQQGFLGPFTLDPGFLRDYKDTYCQRLITRFSKPMAGAVYSSLHLHSASFFNLMCSPPIIERVKSLLGPSVLMWLATAFTRPPKSPGVPWHSDSINQYLRGVHVSLAITNMTPANGCLQLIPKTHLYRASLRAASDAKLMRDSLVSEGARYADEIAPWNAPHSVVSMNLQPFQFFFMWGGTWHMVGENATSHVRVAAVARFARTDVTCKDYGFSDCVIADGRKLPCVLVSGQDDFHLNDFHDPPQGDIF